MQGPFRPPEGRLNDGDVFEGVGFPIWSKAGDVQYLPRRVVIASHGCDCDDYAEAVKAGRSDQAAKMRVHAIPLQLAARFPDDKLDQIRGGEVYKLFFIQGGEELADSVADLSAETALPAAHVLKGRHLVTLATWQWQRLLVHLGVERWHQAPAYIFRPERLPGGEETPS